MSGWQVTEQAVSAMRNLSEQLQELADRIHQECGNVKNVFVDNLDGLGAHSDAIAELIERVAQIEHEGSNQLAKLRLKLALAQKSRMDHIENNRYGRLNGDGTATDGVSGSATFQPATQSEHKVYVPTHMGQVAAVQEDVKAGSGRIITPYRAVEMVEAVRDFTSEGGSTVIREAYGNPNADPKAVSAMNNLDDYIRSAPKWKGRVFRGINVTRAVADEIMAGPFVDMGGPSSWSSDQQVAERFSRGYKKVRIVFVLDDSKSGASVAHIGSYDGMESEVTAPSGVKYYIDKIYKESRYGSDIIFIDVHE